MLRQSRLHRMIQAIETTTITPRLFIATFFSFIVFRMLIHYILNDFHDMSVKIIFFATVHYFLEFLVTFLLFLFLFRTFKSPSVSAATNILLLQFFFIFLPPILDAIIMPSQSAFAIYQFGSLSELLRNFITFFGSQSTFGITPGIRIAIIASIIITFFYSLIYTKNIFRSLKFAFISYIILFVISSFPAWITFLVEWPSKALFSISDLDQVQLFLSPLNLFQTTFDYAISLRVKLDIIYCIILAGLTGLLLLREFPSIFWALLKNARFPQLIYHAGLFLLGITLSLTLTQTSFPLELFPILSVISILIAIECAWVASVIVNDLHDTDIDAVTNIHRPLVTQSIDRETYKTIGYFFFFASLLFSVIISFPIFFLLLSYQAIAWIYSAHPLRLKRFPIIATLLAASASLLILFSGFMLIAPNDLHLLPKPLFILLLIGYTLLLPIKDFKDIPGDRADGVFTFPVLLGEARAKLLIGGAAFLLFIGSIFILHIPSLFLPAFFFGSLAFWLLQKSTLDHPLFPYRHLAGWFIGITCLYGIFILLLAR